MNMHAIIYQGDIVKGVYPDMTEEILIVEDHILVEELPEEVIGVPANERCLITSFDPLIIVREPIPPTPLSPEDKIAVLEAENAELRGEIATATEMTLTAYGAVADVFEMVLALQDQVAQLQPPE
jgi:hypothetical protein